MNIIDLLKEIRFLPLVDTIKHLKEKGISREDAWHLYAKAPVSEVSDRLLKAAPFL